MTTDRRFLSASCVVGTLLLLAAPRAEAQAEQPRRIPRIDQIGEWRAHDPVAPEPGYEPWTPNDAARLLARFSDAVLRVEARSSYPIGNTYYTEKGAQVRELRTHAANLGTSVDGRLCVALRPDVFHILKQGISHCDASTGGGGCDLEGNMDGRFGEKEDVVKTSGFVTGGSETSLVDGDASWWPGRWKHRLVVLRPGMANEESRRVVASDRNQISVDRAWTTPPSPQDRYEVRGSFDPRWFQRVPRQVHADMVNRLWERLRNVCDRPGGICNPPAEPLDPFDPRNQRGWGVGTDREATLALSTPTSVPAIYGFVRNGGSRPGVLEDPYFQVSSVVMRLDDPDYRAWKTRYALYKLRDHGFAPGDATCLMVAYKPGLHTAYDAEANGASTDICAVEGSNMWTGPTHVCRRDRPRRLSPGGPFHPTQYGPGDFEQAISSFLLEMVATLEENGYRNPRVITIERPDYQARHWNILSAEVLDHPALAGELGDSFEPALSLIGRRPDRPVATPTPPPNTPPTSPPPAAPPSAPPAQSPSTPVAEAPPPTAPESPSSPSGPSWSLGSGGGGSAGSGRSSSSAARSSRGQVLSSGGGGGTVEAPGGR